MYVVCTDGTVNFFLKNERMQETAKLHEKRVFSVVYHKQKFFSVRCMRISQGMVMWNCLNT